MSTTYPVPPQTLRKYARVENELRQFIDTVFRDPDRNFGLDTIQEMDINVHLVRFPPENLRQYPAIVFMQRGINPLRRGTGGIEKFDSEGRGYTGMQYQIVFEIHAIIEKHAAMVYNGVKYQHIEGNITDNPSTEGPLDVLKSIITWTLLANWTDCDPDRDWGWRNLTINSIDFLRNYNSDKNLYGVRFRCMLDWEWDVSYDDIGDIG